MGNAVLYIRVSTDEQANQTQNLPTQKRKLEDRCERDGLTVLKSFVDTESARTTDRPEFQALLNYCRKPGNKVTHVVFADLSRLARNVADQSVTLTGFKKLGITPVSCDETIEDSAAGKLSVNLLGVVNQFYSDSLSERVQYRMAAGVKQGRWLWKAPLGYVNTSDGVKIDPERGQLIHKAFELVASRSYGLVEVRHRITVLGLTTRQGRPLTKQTLSQILRNQLYAGWVVSGTLKAQGQHEPLVSQSLFDAVQDALEGKRSPAVAHKKLNTEFALKGFVRCAGCENKLTAGFAKGRKDKYPRYWCWNPKCSIRVSASRDEIELSFMRILAMLVPTQEFINRLPDIAKTYWAHRLERITTERRALSNRLNANKTLNQKILLQKVHGELSADDFAILKENIVQEKTDVEAQLSKLDSEGRTMQDLLEETQNNIVDLVGAWTNGTTEQRQELAFSLYPEGLVYSRETRYFEPRNTLLMNGVEEMITSISSDFEIGGPTRT